MKEEKKRTFCDNESRKRNISTSMRQYHYNLRHSALNENYADISFEDLVDDDRSIVEDKFLQVTNSITSQFLSLLRLIFKRKELEDMLRAETAVEENSGNKKKIIISPDQKQRIFKDDENDI